MHTIPLAESGSEWIRTDIEKINDYIIERNPEGVKKLLLLHGITRCSTIRDMQLSLLSLVRSEGESFIAQLLEEHPDYEMIVCDYQAKNPSDRSRSEEPVIIKKRSQPKPVLPMNHSRFIAVDFSLMSISAQLIQLLMFLVCVWVVLKIFKD